jgi:membrane-associated phospholipid phosphatase
MRALESPLGRALAAAVLVGLYVAIYFAAGLRPVEGASLATPLDRTVPFRPAAVFVYASTYPMVLGPLFLVRDAHLFARTWLGYALCLAVCGVVFVLLPVGSLSLRADLSTVPTSTLAGWGIHVLYALDPPRNCFPSLHLALAFTGTLAVGRARRWLGGVGAAWIAALTVSVVLVKQHYVVDALAGLALGWAAHLVLAGRWRPADAAAARDAFVGPGGAIGLVAFVAAAFAGAGLAWTLDVPAPAPIWID